MKPFLANLFAKWAMALGWQAPLPLIPIPVQAPTVVLYPALWTSADPYLADATDLCQKFDPLPGVSDEYKRHQVWASMLDLFPTAPRRALSMAIERAHDAL